MSKHAAEISYLAIQVTKVSGSSNGLGDDRGHDAPVSFHIRLEETTPVLRIAFEGPRGTIVAEPPRPANPTGDPVSALWDGTIPY